MKTDYLIFININDKYIEQLVLILFSSAEKALMLGHCYRQLILLLCITGAPHHVNVKVILLISNLDGAVMHLFRLKVYGELTYGGRDGAPSLWDIQPCGHSLFLRHSVLDVPAGAVLLLQWRLLPMVIFHVVVQQLSLTEGFCAAWSAALKRVVVKIDGQDWRRLVFDDSVDWHRQTEAYRGFRFIYILHFFPFHFLILVYECPHVVLC